MRKTLITSFFILSLLISFVYPLSADSDIYKTRRDQVLSQMSENDLLIIQTTSKGNRFGFNFQQNSNLFYLTGMPESDIILILSKTGIKLKKGKDPLFQILLLNPPYKKSINKNDFFDHLKNSAEFDLVSSPLQFRKILKKIDKLNTLYTNLVKKDQKDSHSLTDKKLLKFLKDHKNVKINKPYALTAELRRIKNDAEIKKMQKAIDITSKAHLEAFKSMQPGMYEYQIEAVIEYVFRYNGSQQLAFPTIVGSGPNSLDLHYEQGTRQIEANDMIVMDIGCEFEHYCADITRTIPANGKFSPQQKEIYNIVLEANQAVIDALRPGLTMAQMDSIANAVIAKYGYEKYIRHGCTHHLGLDVHDVGNTKKPLKPGCVVTVEPGIYIHETTGLPEEYWNIGIRIEDDVLITPDGHKNLSAGLPKTIEEIEKIMAADGLGNIEF